MEWKTHVAGGVLFGIAGLAVFGPGPMRYFDLILWTVFWALVPLVEVQLPLERRSPLFHSAFFVAAVALALFGASTIADHALLSARGAAFASLGIASHILLDSFTATGVPLLYPLYPRRHLLFPHFGHTLRYGDRWESERIQYLALVLLIALLVLDVLKSSVW
jgi:membrane-bound metal-dependent hydrolase YbcI (DUF457 family)